MVGEKIHELTCKISGYRAVTGGEGDVEIEASLQPTLRCAQGPSQGTGRLMGVDTTELCTYTACRLESGALYGEGQGAFTTKDGDAVSWFGSGIGKPTGRGMGAVWRASIHYVTDAPKLARLNAVLGVVEWEVDEAGNARGAVFEWR